MIMESEWQTVSYKKKKTGKVKMQETVKTIDEAVEAVEAVEDDVKFPEPSHYNCKQYTYD